MSGFYDLSPSFTKGCSDDKYLLQQPELVRPQDHRLAHARSIKHHSQIHILSGQGAYEAPDASRRFSRILWEKGIWHNLDLWGHDMPHDWPTWRKMLDHYVDARLGF